MRSSSTRLRIGGALAATSLSVLVGLGGTAFAESNQGEARPNDSAAASQNGRTADEAALVTEDNDRNDGSTANNVVDSSDNAHPSGNDRSVENGSSGNQGKATSEPDGNDSGPERDAGGIDQPGNPGGVDLADQDGNNGCGNDDDFEDDNEGNCGKPAETSPVTPTTPETSPVTPTTPETSPVTPTTLMPSTPPVVDAGATPAVVLGTQAQNTPNAPASVNPAVPTQVLGISVERPTGAAAVIPAESGVVAAADFARPTTLTASGVQSAGLARTGFGTSSLVLVAISLLLAGFGLVRRPKGGHFTA